MNFFVGSRKRRGVVKGFNVIKKRQANKDEKLSITFSKRFGGAVGVNRRAFIDVVVHIRWNAPLVGVEKWSQISPSQSLSLKNIYW